MDKYEVLGLLGEGCFGRVYKAKQICDSTKVALKVISKRGRSVKEIKALRRECEIQRHLHHPNIIQMLDSFETDNELVVITEFAHKELTTILSKEVYLPEEKVQTIVWDLVSALYYLHSHRVLHRDLKPQNILLDSRNSAKLCDFGFARNMSTGTHVLTSIKGTPLYMAPELIEEHPYDHGADLWSLGCIIYELLVGAPPFCTTSILQLIRKVRHEEIELPTFISSSCTSFLKGLLQKDPKKRLTWPEILKHSFVKDHILILEDIPTKPLTRPLSFDTLQAKEEQRKNCLTQKAHTKLPSSKSTEVTSSQAVAKCNSLKTTKTCATSNTSVDRTNKKSSSLEKTKVSVGEKFEQLSVEYNSCESQKSAEGGKNDTYTDDESRKTVQSNVSVEAAGDNVGHIKQIGDKLNLSEDSSPIENDEWIVFLRRTIEEVMAGEMTSLCQPSLANIVVSPLRNTNTSSKVLAYVASLFSSPFVVPGTSDSILKQIKKVYLDIKLIPNLVNASKLLLKHKTSSCSFNTSVLSPCGNLSLHGDTEEDFRPISDLTEEDLHALERLYLLICHLVYIDIQFLNQFCDAIVILSMCPVLQKLLFLSKEKLRIAADVVAILTHVVREFPENFDLIDQIITVSNCEAEENETIDFVRLLRHTNLLLRERSCYFLQFLGKSSTKRIEGIWSPVMKDTLEALVYDSMENVRNAAEAAVDELKKLPFYDKKPTSNENESPAHEI